jgi:predicted CXXCH cytochrome family protein
MILTRQYFKLLNGFRIASACIFLAAMAGSAYSEEQDNLSCVGCHETPGLSTQFSSSEILPLTIDAAALKSSVHGTQRCTTCHDSITAYPHPPKTAKDYREFQLESSKQCQTCHVKQAKQHLDGMHAQALAAGNRNAAICIDCHGSHSIGSPNVPRHQISTNCGKCHGAIYAQYIGSAHGKSLLEADNPDVPVCTDCHKAHNLEDPKAQAVRLRSPRLCAKCHADAKLMRKYGITSEVFNTYVADFHGLTVTLFDKQQPDQRINTAVCTDCHGIHDILKVTDANSSVIKQNLLGTCRKCHPQATLNFPDSWMGHYPPTKDRHALVYWVNLFYGFLIPIAIGGMILFVLIDAGGRIVRRFRKGA